MAIDYYYGYWLLSMAINYLKVQFLEFTIWAIRT